MMSKSVYGVIFLVVLFISLFSISAEASYTAQSSITSYGSITSTSSSGYTPSASFSSFPSSSPTPSSFLSSTPTPSPSSNPSPSTYPTPTPTSSPASTFGLSVKGGTQTGQPAGIMIGSRFTDALSGTPVSMSVALSNPSNLSNTIIGAIYQDSNGMLIASTSSTTVSGGFSGWLTLSFGSSGSLSSGSSYSLVVWFGGSNCSIWYNSGGNNQSWYAYQAYSGSFPSGPYSGFSMYGQESNVYSIYCTLGSSGSSPSPSPSPLPTATVSPSPSPIATSPPTPSPTPIPSSSLKISRVTYASKSYSPSQEVQYFDIWIGHWDAISSLAVPAKGLNPNFKALLYCNTLLRYSSGSNDPSGTFTTFMNNGWLLKDTNGNYVTETGDDAYFVDFGNPAVWNWYANWLNGYVTQYKLDGVQLDNINYDLNAFYTANTQNAVNPRTGNVWTNNDVLNAYISFISTVKNTLGPTKIVLGNGVYNGLSVHFYSSVQQLILQSGIDGVISEGWMGPYSVSWLSESNWLASINMAIWIQSNLLASRSLGMFMPICGAVSTNPDVPGGSAGDASLTQQYTTYCYASLLLAANSPGNAIFFGTTDSYSQGLFNINVGTPSGSFYQVSGSHVYARDFSNGKVLVNPTSSSYTISLSGHYKLQSGSSAGSSITVSPETGVILNSA